MDARRKSYLLFAAGFAGALFFLWFKMTLYDKLEYEADLFSILQLTRDFLWGKPLLYENAYGNNMAYHNYYLLPLYAPFTLTFGGKGLFVAGFAVMLWAWVLLTRIGKSLPLWKGVLLAGLFFSPTALFLWDNYHFGWHPETLYYPLAVVFTAALVLRNRPALWVSGLFIVLNREDGILLVWALYVLYHVASQPQTVLQTLKKLAPVSLGAVTVFLSGMVWLHFSADGQSRMADTATRFLQQYTPAVLGQYLQSGFGSWFLLCGTVWLLACVCMGRLSFAGWSLLALLPLMAGNLYSGAYYFPDLKYGINWAPRLAGTYGFLVSALLLGLVYGKPFRKPVYAAVFLAAGMGIAVAQYTGLKNLMYYYRYSTLDRIHLALFRENVKEKDLRVLARLQQLAERLPANYPVRLDDHLFALFDRTDYICALQGRKPWREPKMVITNHRRGGLMEPIPAGFEKIAQIGLYEVWAEPGQPEIQAWVN